MTLNGAGKLFSSASTVGRATAAHASHPFEVWVMAIVVPSRKTSGKQAPQPSIGEKAQRNAAGGAVPCHWSSSDRSNFCSRWAQQAGNAISSGSYKMRKELLTALAASSLALGFAGSPVLAQDTVRVRGTIEKVEANALMVKS